MTPSHVDRGRGVVLALAALAIITAPAASFAHHSFAMYDQARIVTLKGTVKSFEWTNPHSLILVLVPLAAGDPELWSVELPTSPGNLARLGWSRRSLTPGDKVAIDINPLRDGRHGGSLKKVVLVDTGKILTAAAPSPAGPANP